MLMVYVQISFTIFFKSISKAREKKDILNFESVIEYRSRYKRCVDISRLICNNKISGNICFLIL